MDWQEAFIIRARDAYPQTWWVNAPQNAAKPFVTLLDVTELRGQTLNGFDLEFARVQVDAWGFTYADVQAAMAALIGETGSPGPLILGGTFSGRTFQRADIVLGPRDFGGEREGDTIIYRKTADLMIAHD
jgi:hypothetical protein